MTRCTFGGGLLHRFEWPRAAQALVDDVTQLLRGRRQGIDEVVGVVRHRPGQRPGTAQDGQDEHRGTQRARDVHAGHGLDEGGQRVIEDEPEHQRDEEGAGPLEDGQGRQGGQDDDAQVACIGVRMQHHVRRFGRIHLLGRWNLAEDLVDLLLVFVHGTFVTPPAQAPGSFSESAPPGPR
jgi:hypothetical protein